MPRRSTRRTSSSSSRTRRGTKSSVKIHAKITPEVIKTYKVGNARLVTVEGKKGRRNVYYAELQIPTSSGQAVVRWENKDKKKIKTFEDFVKVSKRIGRKILDHLSKKGTI